ncbi:MAG: hypothetical protein LUC43_08085 [Burkholderiales bacterium]|nr:hypothetical protein [Burkholderiales bacterium]
MKLKQVAVVLCAGLMSVSLSSCSSVFGEIDPPIASEQLMAMQTRDYHATVDQVFAAIISTFQDSGYIISSADKSTGLVIASSLAQPEIPFMSGYVRTTTDKIVTSVRALSPKEVQVRLNIVRSVQVSETYGLQAQKEFPRTIPEVYDQIFNQIQVALNKHL